jgi:hypothetical protein
MTGVRSPATPPPAPPSITVGAHAMVVNTNAKMLHDEVRKRVRLSMGILSSFERAKVGETLDRETSESWR